MERYVTGKDPNTKDWFLYDNVTDKYICWDSEKAVKARENTEKITNLLILIKQNLHV